MRGKCMHHSQAIQRRGGGGGGGGGGRGSAMKKKTRSSAATAETVETKRLSSSLVAIGYVAVFNIKNYCIIAKANEPPNSK